MERTYYYKDFSDDVIKSKEQEYKLKSNYKWIKSNLLYRIFSAFVYFIFFIIGHIYFRLVLHAKIINKSILKNYNKTGYFLYGNHTQTIGDVFIPGVVCSPKRIYVVVSQANLGIPILGKILPMLGAIPIPDTIKKMKEFSDAIDTRINQTKPVVIYPEAHVWPYYTNIRPFNESSFKFQVKDNMPAFCITTTYYKRKYGKKPGIKVFVDGPFMPDHNLNKKEQAEKLSKEVHTCMTERSKNSTYEFVEYKKT